uniref:Major facilitator superfamily associated domain-containing protein n=1 Tax=Clytia hemisphaerica TaxID=252671 RepID=A0A7M5UKN1_9CNID
MASNNPPPYNAIFRQVKTQEDFSENESESDVNNLTSIYEEEQDGLFGGLSLFYFLLHSSFSALFPFLSIILHHRGLSYSQIGTVYTLMFLTSCLSSCIWTAIVRQAQIKHSVMLVSIGSWLVAYVPLLWVKNRDPLVNCVITKSNTSFNTSEIFLSGNNRTPNTPGSVYKTSNQAFAMREIIDQSLGVLQEWGNIESSFLIVLIVIVAARLFQSTTDYFYFEHNRLLYPETIHKKLSKPSYHVSTKISAAVITIFVGYVLDSVIFCNPTIGHFQIVFYMFIVFTAFALFVLYFLDFNHFEGSSMSINIWSDNRQTDIQCPFVLKSLLITGMIVSGFTRGSYYTFISIRLASFNAYFMQIGSVFAVHKITETCLKMLRKSLCQRLDVYQMFIIIFTMDSIRHLYFGYMETGLMVWFLLPLELLSGFSALLYPNVLQCLKIDSDGLISEKLFFVSYWCIGFSIGPIIFGFGYEMLSGNVIFKMVGLLNLSLAFLFGCCYCCRDNGETNLDEINNNDFDSSDENRFLLTQENSF